MRDYLLYIISVTNGHLISESVVQTSGRIDTSITHGLVHIRVWVTIIRYYLCIPLYLVAQIKLPMGESLTDFHMSSFFTPHRPVLQAPVLPVTSHQVYTICCITYTYRGGNIHPMHLVNTNHAENHTCMFTEPRKYMESWRFPQS